jgi:hypothetical protein
MIMSISAFAQEKRWTLALSNQDTIYHCSLEYVLADSLSVRTSGGLRSLSAADITTMQYEKDSKFWTGAGLGFCFGALTGGVIGAVTYEKKPDSFLDFGPGFNVIVGAFGGGGLGFMTGGVIGLVLGADEVYDFTSLTAEEKITLLKQLITKR